ncbi:hypothetical protein [Natronobeatus ordinarius]|uniref:hypothetical protein n=1 Tax=Natronobeatus ordinarius TaxID=2963433 RepID=UPI0020CF08FE|nr:hypothetical protein [Natronobeatus ordinarius]
MYSPSRGILYADLPSADEDENEETRTRSRVPPADAESTLEEPSADAPAHAVSHPVSEPADD